MHDCYELCAYRLGIQFRSVPVFSPMLWCLIQYATLVHSNIAFLIVIDFLAPDMVTLPTSYNEGNHSKSHFHLNEKNLELPFLHTFRGKAKISKPNIQNDDTCPRIRIPNDFPFLFVQIKVNTPTGRARTASILVRIGLGGGTLREWV